MADKKTTAKAPEVKYSRESLVVSKKYAGQRDAIILALDADKEYTLAEADAAISKLLSRPVVEEINGKGDK